MSTNVNGHRVGMQIRSDAEISPRHLSFLETGRSRPSVRHASQGGGPIADMAESSIDLLLRSIRRKNGETRVVMARLCRMCS